MPQISARVSADLAAEIEAYSDENGCTKSDAVRVLLERGVEYNRIQDENARLQRNLQQLLEQREEHTELVEYVEEERSLQQRREERERMKDEAGVLTRAKWWVTGMPAADAAGSDEA